MLNSFEEEVKKAWSSFAGNSLERHKGDIAIMNGGIDVKALEKGWKDNKWSNADTKDYIKMIR